MTIFIEKYDEDDNGDDYNMINCA